MALALFYHLTRSSVEDTASQLLSRALGAGWRVMVRGRSRPQLEALDRQLWLEPADGFLPHGLEGGPQDADQPVLLGIGPIGNGATALMLVDGAETEAVEAKVLERVWILFDGNAPEELDRARSQWKTLTAQGVPAQYWSEESGRWQMKTEKKPE